MCSVLYVSFPLFKIRTCVLHVFTAERDNWTVCANIFHNVLLMIFYSALMCSVLVFSIVSIRTCVFRTYVFHPCTSVLAISILAFSILAKCPGLYLDFPYLCFLILAISAPPPITSYWCSLVTTSHVENRATEKPRRRSVTVDPGTSRSCLRTRDGYPADNPGSKP